jgi:hypothetical protein
MVERRPQNSPIRLSCIIRASPGLGRRPLERAVPFAAFDPANHCSIASPKSAQLLLTGRWNSLAPLSSRASGEQPRQSDIRSGGRGAAGGRFRANAPRSRDIDEPLELGGANAAFTDFLVERCVIEELGRPLPT